MRWDKAVVTAMATSLWLLIYPMLAVVMACELSDYLNRAYGCAFAHLKLGWPTKRAECEAVVGEGDRYRCPVTNEDGIALDAERCPNPVKLDELYPCFQGHLVRYCRDMQGGEVATYSYTRTWDRHLVPTGVVPSSAIDEPFTVYFSGLLHLDRSPVYQDVPVQDTTQRIAGM